MIPVEKNLRRSGTKFRNFAYKVNLKFSKFGTFEISGSHDKKIRKCLQQNSAQNLCGIFRREILQQSWVEKNSAADLCIILKVSQHGEIKVIDEDLIRCRTAGTSGKGKIKLVVRTYGKKSFLIPHITFMKWFISNYGKKHF